MSDDLLARATRALRETSDDGSAPPPVLETRHRVLATLRQKRTNRVVWLRRILPIAAVLVTSSAWAAANGHLGGTMRQVAAYVGLADEAAPSTPLTRSTLPPQGPLASSGASVPSVPSLRADASSPSDLPLDPPERAEDAVAVADPPARPDVEAPPGAVRAPAASAAAAAPRDTASPAAARPQPVSSSVAPRASGAASSSPRASASADDPAQGLYAAAHQKHFTERDYGGALAAWDRYLRAAPGGRFAAEAQYNRAICLVRLGRNAEAKPALRAFADGGYGGYRQSEAKALLAALPDP